MHPLEGKYIVFDHRECDREDEGTVLTVYQMKRGELEPVFTPSVAFDPISCNAKCVDFEGTYFTPSEWVARMLRKIGVKEVVTVSRDRDFFGVPYDCRFLDDEVDEDGAYTNWFEYETVFDTSDGHSHLVEVGINVRLFDEPSQEFIEE